MRYDGPVTVSIEEAAAHWRRREADALARATARAKVLRGRLPAARSLLVERFGARRVVLFGSLARGDVTERSDVDLAVLGLRSEDYFKALAELGGLFESPVDLVEIERASSSLLARLQLEGVEIKAPDA
ncbi:MAG: nucleotidyltransferase domain-containing protein [Planctomycetes bacterium]|nr:nucleotidyltransferase domain-containing protein [Planctomycetota bacterium]